MKKAVSLFLTLCMVMTLFLPSQIFAQQGKTLEGVINVVKSKIDIPKDLSEFNYSASTDKDKKIWNLSWRSKEDNGGSLNVSIREDGKILNYNYYKGYDPSRTYGKLPKISRQEAQIIAMDFIKKVNPDVLPQLKLKDEDVQNVMDTTYNFRFNRIIDSIFLNANYISVNVDRFSGLVQNYYSNWMDDLKFPSKDKIISYEDAKKLYKDNLGLELSYNYRIEDKKIVVYLAYKQKLNDDYIDALTGEKVQLQDNHYGPYFDRDNIGGSDQKNAKKELTPEEQKAVDEVAGILTQEKAEKVARDIKELELTNEFKVSNASLYKDWVPTNNLIWAIEFINEDKDSEINKYASVRMNAKTGEIINFYNSTPYSEQKAKYDKDSSKKMAEDFLKQFCSNKFANSTFNENNDPARILDQQSEQKELPKSYSFNYIRKVNSIPFNGNYVTVVFDAVNGKVTGFDSNWFDIKFTSLDKVKPIDEAYNKLFDDIGYELQYMLKHHNDAYFKYQDKDVKPEVYLVYSPNPDKPLVIDAMSGILLDNSGNPYKEKKLVNYIDIDTSFAKNEISVLADYGISFDADKFNPKNNIVQKEFLYLLSKAVYPYNSYSLEKKKDIDKMYDELIREGIIKQSEKAPNANVSREESVKYVIRLMKYDKVADLKDIFKCEFKDSDIISPDLVGYVAIAQGLKIVSGHDGYFNPQDQLTKEQAAMIIYNYLK